MARDSKSAIVNTGPGADAISPLLARRRRTAIRLGIYGGRDLVHRERMPLYIRRAFRIARPRKGRHHPGKKAFLNWLLNGRIERDLCITALAPCFNVDVRTLSRWVKEVRALTIIDPGHGRDLGLRVIINRAQAYQSMDELALGERQLADRRRRRPLFFWKPDPSPTPLSTERKLRDLQPIGTIVKPLIPNPWKPSATRFEDLDPDPDALRAAVKGRNEQTKEKIPMEATGEAQSADPSPKPTHELSREREIRRSRREVPEIPIEQMPDWLQHFVKLGTQSVNRKTSTETGL